MPGDFLVACCWISAELLLYFCCVYVGLVVALGLVGARPYEQGHGEGGEGADLYSRKFPHILLDLIMSSLAKR